jgi:hypothetical protein
MHRLIATFMFAFALAFAPLCASAKEPGSVGDSVAVQTTPAAAENVPRVGSSADEARYAAREAASPGAKNYNGGDAVIVISASAAVLILAIVLIVVLI